MPTHRDRMILRCYAEQQTQDLWIAVCIDLNLAVQGESYRSVRKKLNAQIDDYLYDAMVGDDHQYVDQLIPRYAPLKFFLKYYLSYLRVYIRHTIRDFPRVIHLQPRSSI